MNAALVGVRFLDAVHAACRQQASDIHFQPGNAVALRVDGELRHLPGTALVASEVVLLASHLAGPDALDRIESDGDVTATYVHEGLAMRAHVFAVRDGIAIALRLLHRDVPSLASLDLPHVVASFVDIPRGLVIFAGPTGSGKSTSLAALVDAINRTRRRRIITIEDPIEYRHGSIESLIAQRSVTAAPNGLRKALESALRADPDVIVVGEMRDTETMRMALAAAETGHLVLTTLHTGDAPQTIDRIVDAFPGNEQPQIRSQLSIVLEAVVCQRLVRRTGGRGRRVAAEVLIANAAARNLIREGRAHQLHNVIATSRAAGMQTLDDHLHELVESGEIERDDAERLAVR